MMVHLSRAHELTSGEHTTGTFTYIGDGRTDMSRAVWVRADDSIDSVEERVELMEIAATLGVDGILVDVSDLDRARGIFDGTIATFYTGGDGHVLEVTQAEQAPGDVVIVGKQAEGDGTIERPPRREDSGDLAVLEDLPGEVGAFVNVDGEDAADLARWAGSVADIVIIGRPDWQIIPLENLIAEVGDQTMVMATVDSAEAARTAFETLELGADGVLLETTDPSVIEKTLSIARSQEDDRIGLQWATVTAVESTGMADRVCVDMSSLLDADEGLLIGSHARGLVFVHGETAEGPYADPRPFRVNAGAVHAYVMVPDGETKYLAELKGGDRVLVVDTEGSSREAVVGRAKIERRPMSRVVLETDDGDVIETLVQHAETVRLHTRTQGSLPITEIEPAMEVALYYEDVPRHFGKPVEGEMLVER